MENFGDKVEAGELNINAISQTHVEGLSIEAKRFSCSSK